jgi:hypothetical protein
MNLLLPLVLTTCVVSTTADPPPLPIDFDARARWPGCATRILNQGACGR